LLKDLLNEFENHETESQKFDVDQMVIDSYRLKPGLYLRLNKDGSTDELFVDKKVAVINAELYTWFQKADFHSSLIEMNKPVDKKKKIHSNNIYTFFCKYDTFIINKALNIELIESIERYYGELLKDMGKIASEILANAGYEPLKKEKVNACKARISSEINKTLVTLLQRDIKDNCYVKLFIEADENDYRHEGNRYLLPRIFNCDTYNLEHNDEVLGLSNSNMGLNAKKPYLEHKTAAFKVPYRISSEEAIMLRKYFLWLGSQKREDKPVNSGYIPVLEHKAHLLESADDITKNKSTHYMHFEKGMDITIDDYDFLPRFSDKLSKPVSFKNYLNTPKFSGGEKARLSEVEKIVNLYLYDNQLVFHYGTENVKVTTRLSAALAKEITLTRDVMAAWFKKGDPLPLSACLKAVTLRLIIARLQNLEYISNLACALNVRLALLKHFELEEEKDMGTIIENQYLALKEKVLAKKENAFCESKTEFYLAAGQLLRYLLSRSQAQKANYDVLLRGVLAANSAAGVKEQVNKLLTKYSYDVEITNPRFNRMLTIVNSYDVDVTEAIGLDALLCGFATESIIYFKNEEDKTND
jgi:CRISPR-associated protein Csh1